MHYVDEGAKDQPVFLLLHGEPTWSYLYRKMIPILQKDGFRVIALDFIGFGKSDKFSDKNEYSYERSVKWLKTFIEKLEINEIKSLKYIPKIWTALSYLLLLLFSLMLFFGRNFEIIRIAPLVDVFPDFYNHISNFSLSLIIYIPIGYVGLMADLTLRHIIVIGLTILLLIVSNVYLL
jgi:hypothetical protein